MTRIFFALWPPAATAAALALWAEELSKISGGKAVRHEQIHLTLAFLGDADAGKAIEAARTVSARARELALEEARYWKHNQIVWAGPRRTPRALAGLVDALHLELYRREFILERRPFAAHVTLIRKARAPAGLPPLPTLEWPVTEFVLVQSRVSREGSTYTPLERFPLRG